MLLQHYKHLQRRCADLVARQEPMLQQEARRIASSKRGRIGTLDDDQDSQYPEDDRQVEDNRVEVEHLRKSGRIEIPAQHRQRGEVV